MLFHSEKNSVVLKQIIRKTFAINIVTKRVLYTNIRFHLCISNRSLMIKKDKYSITDIKKYVYIGIYFFKEDKIVEPVCYQQEYSV